MKVMTIKYDAALSPVVGKKNQLWWKTLVRPNKEKTKETIVKDPMDRKRC